MGNRNMAVKHARGVKQRTEYAMQQLFTELSKPETDMMMHKGKLVPRNPELCDADLIAAYRAKQTAAAATKVVNRQTYRKGYAWSR